MKDEKEQAIEAIRKKLVGKKLTYDEIYAVMDEVAHNRLGDVLTTYFTASGYSKGFSKEELYFLTRAMVETGEKLSFKGIVADKHSIGGVPGTRTTLVIVPIVAAAGFLIPKSSSRAITTPDGTADDMEVLANVEFTREEIYDIVKKTNGCIVWGGSFHIAPADDVMIRVERELVFESYDKIIVSIMAKKVAFGSNHVVIDLPFGKTVKVHRREDAEALKEKFEYIAHKFDIHIKVLIHETNEPVGRGIGPILETREALKVLEQEPDRPFDLEERSLRLAGALLDLCITKHVHEEKIKGEFGNGYGWAKHILATGNALRKMKDIIEAQGGDRNVSTSLLTTRLGSYCRQIAAGSAGIITAIDSKNITTISRILGAPNQKGAGIYLHKKLREPFKKGDTLYSIYSESMYNIREALESVNHFPFITI